ncbi:sigma factor-like helix-turn-helix DNA-binding protein [Mycoplasmopsis opalescens]|uniref:sigma factor-like helix-turn-helix DNA-binding protein n=1 Tax=Mycoplasmopsis opalescens TaxID=114886 RepID=UPI0004A7063D|nr:sigma factor-like helix-turn-helix DNA-binding protein [Mycoplasmopsis opalescens]
MTINNVVDFDKYEHYIDLFEKYASFLTQTQKQAFILYFHENLSYQEIADIFATTRSAVYDAVSKAIKKLEKIEEKIAN